MKTHQIVYGFLLVFLISILLFQISCKQKNQLPTANLSVIPTTGSPGTNFEFDASGCQDDETSTENLRIRLDWENDGTWDTGWVTDKTHSHRFGKDGTYLVNMEVMDENGGTDAFTTTVKVTTSDKLIPSVSPFTYNTGINYESWKMGRTNMNIAHDLDTITNHFRLIKTFHCEAVGTSSVEMDPTQKEVVSYILSHPEKNIELALGTSNAVLSIFSGKGKWEAGLMTTRSYTDAWVKMLIGEFQSAANVKKHVRVILLGNEIDQSGPPADSTEFTAFYTQWIPAAFNNLKASLAAEGLDEIPVTTIIANYPRHNPADNVVASSVTAFVKANWASSWNSGKAFVLFNQYTLDWGKEPDFGPVINYFESVYDLLAGSPEVYVGETGYSAEYGLPNEVTVIGEVYNWLDSQRKTGGLTVPLFVFMAFDHSDKPTGQKKMGLFADDAQNKPLGLKTGIIVPAWVAQPKK